MLASSVAMCLQITVIRKVIGLDIFDYIISWLPGLVLAAPVLVVVVVVRELTPDLPMVHLAVGVLSCIIVCGIGLILPKFFDSRRRHKQVGAAAVELVRGQEAESA